MRKGFFFLFSICLFSCGLEDDEEIIFFANYQLKDGAILILQKKKGGYLGATTPNVTWINKKEKNGHEQQVGKISRWLYGEKINFKLINDSIIKIRCIDLIWHQTSIYTININQRIYPNDGSPYLEAK